MYVQEVDIKECTRQVEAEMREIETASVHDCQCPQSSCRVSIHPQHVIYESPRKS